MYSRLYPFSRGLKFATLATLIAVLLPASIGSADMVYSLNNFPADQDGGSLSGHITVIDSAAADGFLNPLEIVNWSFTLSLPSLPTLTVDSLTSSNPALTMSGSLLLIDANDISLPPTQFSFQDNIFVMENLNADRTGYLGLIDWRRSIPGIAESYIARNGKGTPSIADDDVYWERSYFGGDPPLTLGGGNLANPWKIATITAVPEPSSLALLSVVLVTLVARSRSKRHYRLGRGN